MRIIPIIFSKAPFQIYVCGRTYIVLKMPIVVLKMPHFPSNENRFVHPISFVWLKNETRTQTGLQLKNAMSDVIAKSQFLIMRIH